MPAHIAKHKFVLLVSCLVAGLAVVFSLTQAADDKNDPKVELPATPSVKISTVPETAQPGSEVALYAKYEEFIGQNMVFNWCVDDTPLNSLYAGSSDQIYLKVVGGNGQEYPDGSKIIKRKSEGANAKEKVYIEYVTKEDKGPNKGKTVRKEMEDSGAHYVPVLQNEWGRLYGGRGFCKTAPWPIQWDNADWLNTGMFRYSHREKDDPDCTGVCYRLPDPEPHIQAENLRNQTLITMFGLENISFANPQITYKWAPYKYKYDSQGNLTYQKAERNEHLLDPLNESKEAFTAGSTESYRLVDSGRVGYYQKKLGEAGYGVECEAAVVGGKRKCLIYEAYEYIDVVQATKITKSQTADWLGAGAKPGNNHQPLHSVTTYNYYYADIMWSKVVNGKVKVRYYAAPEVVYNAAGFQSFWQKYFNETRTDIPTQEESWEACLSRRGVKKKPVWTQHYNCSYAERSLFPTAFAQIAGKLFLPSWNDNRYNIGQGIENAVSMSRVFSGMTEKESKQWQQGSPRGGGSDKGLLMYRDRDQDGLPDLWEMRYFGAMAGKQVQKGGEEVQKIHFPPCCSDKPADQEIDVTNFVKTVSGDDDWDDDGYAWSNYAEANTNGDPWSSAGIGPYIEKSKVPGSSKSGMANALGDNEFTNYEEFVAGTDPTVADSDGDGVPDEADFSGVEQTAINLKLNKIKTGEDYKVSLRTYGKTTRSSYEGEKDYARVDAVKNLKESGGLALEIKLAVTPGNATLNDDIQVKAAVGNIQNVDPKALYYKWYLNDVPVPSAADGSKYASYECPCTPQYLSFANALGKQSGFGKDTLRFSAAQGVSQACTGVKVMLEVFDPSTDETTIARTEVPVLMDSSFVKTVVCNDSDKKAGKCTDANDKTKSGVNKKNIGVRGGDRVKYKVDLEGYNEASCGVSVGKATSTGQNANREAFMKDLIYRWSVDGVEMTDKSGKGEKFQEITIETTAEARTTTTNKGSSAADASEKDSHFIEVKVYDDKNKLVARKREGIKVMGASVEINPISGINKKPTSKSGEITYEAKKGAKVSVKAIAQYFKPTDKQKFAFTWKRNDEQVNKSTTEKQAGQLDIVAGEKNKTEEEIEVHIASLSPQGQEVEKSDGAITIKVVDDSQSSNSPKAFIENFVPDSIRSVFNIVLTLSAAALVMIFTFGLFGNRSKD